MKSTIQNIQQCQDQLGQMRLTRIRLENAVLSNNQNAIVYFRQKYASQMQVLCTPHVEVAMSDEEDARLKDEIFGAVAGFTL